MNAWQVEDNGTEPSISPDQRQLLRDASTTRKIDTQELNVGVKPAAGNALLQGHTTVIFAVVDSDIVLPVHIADRVVIGRKDWETDENVGIDLMPYGGRERGVSRRHAVLYRNRHVVTLIDMNSTNGTYINGTKLIAYQPRLLREGDELRLGNMRFLISFEL
jgi:pSer/pThr/pTyr-binding forkhead associated (FHA) protein